MAPNSNYDKLVQGIIAGGGHNTDAPGTVYEDGSVKGGQLAGDSPNDYNADGQLLSSTDAVIEW